MKDKRCDTKNLGPGLVLELGIGRLVSGKIQARDGEKAGMEVRGVGKVERPAELEDLHAGHLHRLTERRGQ